MRHLFYLLFLIMLSGCLGAKARPAPAVYDFGLEPISEAAPAARAIRVDAITASESLSSNRIRYRLNYQNPAQVLTYTESRWSAQPAELLDAKIRSSATAASSQASCVLQLHLEAFDQVFESPNTSSGVIQLNATLKDKKSHTTIAHQQIQEQAPANSADAKGGVIALNQASTAALGKALAWANAVAADSSACR